MTTSERVRTFLKVTGVVALVVMTLVYGYIQQKRDRENENRDDFQRACLVESFTQLTNVLTISRGLTKQDLDLINNRVRAQDHLIQRVFHAKTVEESLSAFAKYQARRTRIQDKRKQIQATREANPIPAFPTGACGGKTNQ